VVYSTDVTPSAKNHHHYEYVPTCSPTNYTSQMGTYIYIHTHIHTYMHTYIIYIPNVSTSNDPSVTAIKLKATQNTIELSYNVMKGTE